MDEKLALARKVLEENFDGRDFSCSLSAYEGGACGGGWDGTSNVYISKENLLYLLECEVDNAELFEGMDTEYFDEDEFNRSLEDMACDEAWCDEEEEDGSWSYSGECEELGEYISEWADFINDILSGEIGPDEIEANIPC